MESGGEVMLRACRPCRPALVRPGPAHRRRDRASVPRLSPAHPGLQRRASSATPPSATRRDADDPSSPPHTRETSHRPRPSPVRGAGADEAGDLHQADVLVVDDEPGVRDSICEILRTAGITTCEAGDGQAAIERLGRTRVGAMVVDVRMPRMDGLTMLRRLGESPPAVLVSAYAIEPGERQRLGTKVSSYLQKPFRPQALLDAVASALGRAAR